MVHEYAIDPTCLTNWHRLRFIADAVGVPNGRLVSEYPGKWGRIVMQPIYGLPPLERTRLEIQFSRIKPHLIHPGDRTYNGATGSWLSNAETAHGPLPFRAIVAAENPRTHPGVLTIDDIDAATELWKTNRTLPVPRDAAIMAQTASLLFQVASDIVLVDPNFKPNSERFLRPLEHFLQLCVNRRSKAIPRIRLILKDEDAGGFAGDTFEQYCRNVIAALTPASLQCELVRAREKASPSEKLHNRYVLTDWGGLDFGIGLDDDISGGQSDDVHLLDKEHFDKRWRQYALMEAFDEAVPSVAIEGTKVV